MTPIAGVDVADQHDARQLRRKMGGPSTEVLQGWLALGDRLWVMRHGATLFAAGLDADDARDLYRRLGAHAGDLSRLIDAGRMADIDCAYLHLWAASGILQAQVRERRRPPNYTAWVVVARRFIAACDGAQDEASAAAAAGVSLDEVVHLRAAGPLDVDGLRMLAGLREGPELFHE